MQSNSAIRYKFDWQSEPGYTYVLNYLIERTKNVTSPLNLKQLAGDLEMENGTPLSGDPTFGARVDYLRGKVQKMEKIDMDTKVKLVFGLSVCINKIFLRVLRMNAHVEVDKHNRITKYRADNGILKLKGDHILTTYARTVRAEKEKQNPMTPESTEIPLEKARIYSYFPISRDSAPNDIESYPSSRESSPRSEEDPLNLTDEDIEEILESLEELEELEEPRAAEPARPGSQKYLKSILKIPGSKKRPAEGVLSSSSTSKRTRNSSPSPIIVPLDSAPVCSIPSPREPSPRPPEDPTEDDIQVIPKVPAIVKLECLEEAEKAQTPQIKNPKTAALIKIVAQVEPAQPGIQENPKTILRIPESNKRPAEEVLSSNSPKLARNSSPSPIIVPLDSAPVCSSPTPKEPSSRPPEDPTEDDIQVIPKPPAQIKREEPEEPVEIQPERAVAETPQIKFLEAIRSIVISLDIPSLSHIESKIRRKIRKIRESVISNEEMVAAMELLVARVVNQSVLAENVESVSLIQLLCYLKAVILTLKLEGLEVLLEKVKARIREPASKNKSIPVEKVASALQTTLDVIGC